MLLGLDIFYQCILKCFLCCCSYEGLKNTFYQLQKRLTSMTGEDPLKDKHVSFIGPQVSPHKITNQLRHGNWCSLYILCTILRGSMGGVIWSEGSGAINLRGFNGRLGFPEAVAYLRGFHGSCGLS